MIEAFAEATADPELKGAFASQMVENRSHINMGRRIVEEFVEKPIDAELCRWAVGIAKPTIAVISKRSPTSCSAAR